MAELKIQHILTLAYLLSKGARYNFVPVTTSDLGKSIKKSQQAASKHLLELEGGGFVVRLTDGRRVFVMVTESGHSEMIKLSSALRQSLEHSQSTINVEGSLVSGVGEGAYYMGLSGYARQFKDKIGYVPYAGTLNVKLGKRAHRETIKQLEGMEGTKINGFSDGGRTFGWVKCFACTINRSIKCQLIILERTHHDDSIVELISSVCVRKAAGLRDGARIAISIPLEEL